MKKYYYFIVYNYEVRRFDYSGSSYFENRGSRKRIIALDTRLLNDPDLQRLCTTLKNEEKDIVEKNIIDSRFLMQKDEYLQGFVDLQNISFLYEVEGE